MPSLLVSVRSVHEAQEALAGGAHVIDIKEPAAGPLGKATDTVCLQILCLVAGRRPVSAAMGEMLDAELPTAACRLQFVKWGLADCASCRCWRANALELRAALSRRHATSTPVFVAYADHASAHSPPVEEVIQWCILERMPVLMMDTFAKTGKSLLDWLSPQELSSIASRCKVGGVRLALAGSLAARDQKALRSVPVEWVGVRAAACAGGQRDGIIDRHCVAQLAACFQPLRDSTIADSASECTGVSRQPLRARQ
jgi:uncharacterized protein (UPF0264 family)